MCHTLGVPMGTSFLAPMEPTYRLEWEDANLSMRMMGGINAADPLAIAAQDFVPWMTSYLVDRWDSAGVIARVWNRAAPGMIGMKQPLLSALLPEIAEVAVAAECSVKILNVVRGQHAIDRSVQRSFPHSLVERALVLNSKIRDAGVKPQFAVEYEHLVRMPVFIVEEIAEWLGVTDGQRIADAAQRVKGPTS